MTESWHAVGLELPKETVETVASLLYELGSNGAVEEASRDPEKVRLVAYFNADAIRKEDLLERIRATLSSIPSLTHISPDIVTAANNQWKERWRQWFRPFAIVPGIVVAPSWERYQPKSGETLITLDPGMAFGTGLHATTALCAEAIAEGMGAQSDNPSLLDVGTGSGLLSIVAHRLGIRRLAAIENDPDALSIARKNFTINGAADVTTAAAIAEIAGPFDIVVANILLLTILDLRDELLAQMADGGKLILSGITHDQEARIAAAFTPPLALEASARREEWSCMTFRKAEARSTRHEARG